MQQLFLDFKTISSFICQNKMDAFGLKGSQNFTLKRLVLGEAFCHCCGPTLNSAHYPATLMLLSSSWAVQLGNWFYYSVPVKQFQMAKLASFNMLCIRTHENINIICTGKTKCHSKNLPTFHFHFQLPLSRLLLYLFFLIKKSSWTLITTPFNILLIISRERKTWSLKMGMED